MKIQNINICFALAFNCPYAGNTISSLEILSKKLKSNNCNIYWVFPMQKEHDWIKKIKISDHVIFIKDSYKQATNEFEKIFIENNISLVHSHFEAYDESIAKACKRIKREIKQVWHVHDYLGYTGNFLNKIRCHFSYFRHYYIYGKQAYLLPVSEEMAAFCNHYRKGIFFLPVKKNKRRQKNNEYKKSTTIINGIDLSRIHQEIEINIPRNPFIFLTFGGQAKRKRIDLLVKAGIRLINKGYNIKIRITKGRDTLQWLTETCKKTDFPWLEIIEQTENIGSLFKECSCYVSTATQETMSMAIAEATIIGKPVIQSNIEGTWWNAQNPSTYLFQDKNIDDLSKQMEILINTANPLIIKNCKITQENNLKLLNLDLWCNKIISIYQKI